MLSVVLLSSAYGFASGDAKTADQFFTGFPSYWNIVALYLHIAALPHVLNAVVLLGFSALVFWRIGYIYPSRTPTLRPFTLVFGVCWAVNVVLMVLAHKTSEELLSREGKEKLASEIMRESVRPMGIEIDPEDEEAADEAPKSRKKKRRPVYNPVQHVHFSNFIVQ